MRQYFIMILLLVYCGMSSGIRHHDQRTHYYMVIWADMIFIVIIKCIVIRVYDWIITRTLIRKCEELRVSPSASD